ncbi:MAG: hypothetical protein BAJATHORv1_10226 [Candidatus Thorarchaeota archaeon]|nr:MAG: hypothetical protein BAJATHORv1_10226 [Candidatus Thorarchaeota archaeon]
MIPVNHVSITTTPLASLGEFPYYDLYGIIQGAKILQKMCPVINFEFQNMAEWVRACPPRDNKTKGHRPETWKKSEKHSIQNIVDILKAADLPIMSIHGNRDVGICLCSENPREREIGKDMVRDTFHLAESVGAKVIVFHFWDTYKKHFDIEFLKTTLADVSKEYPSITGSVENVPTHLEGSTPFDLIRHFNAITLDIRWAALYDELEKFSVVVDRIANIHLRGTLQGNQYTLDNAPFTFDEAVRKIQDDWGYSGIFTFEPEHMMRLDSLDAFVQTVHRVANL